jgi:hypothetical protein
VTRETHSSSPIFTMRPPNVPICLLALLLIFTHNAAAATSIITVSQTSPPMPTSSSYTSDSDFQSAMLIAHNFYRGEHNASNLSWNDTSATYASNWAKPCVFKHSVSPFYSPIISASTLFVKIEGEHKTQFRGASQTNITRAGQQARTSQLGSRTPRPPSTPGASSARSTISTILDSRKPPATLRSWCGGVPRRWAAGGRTATGRMGRPGGTWCASTTRLGTLWVITTSSS